MRNMLNERLGVACALLASLAGCGATLQVRGAQFDLNGQEVALAEEYTKGDPIQADVGTRCNYWGGRSMDAAQGHAMGVLIWPPQHFMTLRQWTQAKQMEVCQKAEAERRAQQVELDRQQAAAPPPPPPPQRLGDSCAQLRQCRQARASIDQCSSRCNGGLERCIEVTMAQARALGMQIAQESARLGCLNDHPEIGAEIGTCIDRCVNLPVLCSHQRYAQLVMACRDAGGSE